jgi:hypothetical protein
MAWRWSAAVRETTFEYELVETDDVLDDMKLVAPSSLVIR